MRQQLGGKAMKRPRGMPDSTRNTVGFGFDPGLNMGWSVVAYESGNSTLEPIVIESGVVKNDSSIVMGQRLLELFSFTLMLFVKYRAKLSFVGIEQVNKARGAALKKGNDSTWTLYFVFGMLVMLSYAFGVRYELINPMTMKAQFALDGHADKAVVRAKAQGYLAAGEKIQRSDQSDAIGIAVVAWMTIFNLLLNEKQRAEKKKNG
jgi:Holliday junction resolvasome RuvABC endonuclease subunit